jgi:Nucleoside-diphosphate-sugar pyrophosphorylase involved in lipopolysaccharide biosynthesis/translation initiation factor 2B, gamma/epsilon subunits (eIF-2Bgamma/eIF-2Bepsilon)
MQALILAGGKGTRLRPLTVYTPKPIVPVLNRPFLLYQIDILRRAGIKEIILSLNYQPDKIQHVLGNGSDFGVHIRYVTEPSPMGTAGAYKFAASEIRDTTVVFNGDILTDLDISEVIKNHKEREAEASIVLTPVENPTAYGLVETDDDFRVLRFREKPKPEELNELKTRNINAGIYVLEPSVLDLIPEGENYSFEYGLFPDLLNRGKNFFAFVMEKNYWRDIGTPQSYLQAHHDFFAGKISGFEFERNQNYDVATAASVDHVSIIGDDCVIKPNARIINSVIGQGVHIEEKAVVENSVVWAHTRISNSSQVRNAIIGRSCYVGKNAVVSEGSVLGDKTSLTDYTQV